MKAFIPWIAAFLIGLASAHSEENFPAKPVKIIVPFGVGGGSDTFVRVVQLGIQEANLLPESVVVLNVGGAGGTIGSYRAKNARPDGYTILNLHEGIFTARHSGKCAYGSEAFEPIAATGRVPSVVAVAEHSPYQTLSDLVKAAALKPDTITMGANLGAPSHLIGLELEAQIEGAAFRFVPTGGGSARSKALVGGHLDASAFSLSEILQEEGSGLRTLAILSEERHPALPDVPTAREQGIDVIRSTTQYWWAPIGTPADRIAILSDTLRKAMEHPAAAEKLNTLQVEPFFLTGEALREYVAKEDERAAVMAIHGEVETLEISSALAVACGLLGLAAFFTGSLRPSPAEPDAPKPAWSRSILLGILLLSYVVGMTVLRIPFPWATTVFIFLGGFLLGPRTLKSLLFIAVLGLVLGLGLDWVFTELLVIDLP